MMPLLPIGIGVARACLASTCLVLLVMPVPRGHCGGALRCAQKPSTADSSEHDFPAGSAVPMLQGLTRPRPLGASAPDFPFDVHPVGLSSEGEPHDRHRHAPATARATSPLQ